MALVPKSFIEYLTEVIPGFPGEAKQFSVAKMLWMMTDPSYQHNKYANSINLSNKKITEIFGRSPSFNDINRGSFRYFSVHRFLNGRDSEGRSYNNGYEPKPWMLNALVQYLSVEPKSTGLLNDEGKIVKKVPKAISSKTKKGHSAVGWREVGLNCLVKVSLRNLTKLKQYYLSRENLSNDEDRQSNLHRFLVSSALLCMANSSFKGALIHRYIQSNSGRLYAEGVSLQNCPKEIRNAALEGNWDYDISCCHFSILAQMAKRYGFNCPVIESYVANKHAFRAQIASKVGITITQVKEVLTATIYGARMALQNANAIPKAIGIDFASRLYELDEYKAMRNEITKAKEVILKLHPHTNGRYINDFKMAISTKEKSASIISHLMEGVEASALRSSIKFCGERIVLLQHDGFVLNQSVDTFKLQEAVFRDTGYSFEYEAKQITCPIQKEFVFYAEHDTKTLNDKITNKNKGLEAILSPSVRTMAPHEWDIPPVYPVPWNPPVPF